jgi:cytochrome oxidase Cu insertion factor (SCO1/SenC/PrrC family)
VSSTILILIAALVVVIIVVAVARSRRANDGVDSFRRQIDALSPEARRPVVDQVQNAAGRHPTGDDAGDDADDDADDADDADGEDGARGT